MLHGRFDPVGTNRGKSASAPSKKLANSIPTMEMHHTELDEEVVNDTCYSAKQAADHRRQRNAEPHQELPIESIEVLVGEHEFWPQAAGVIWMLLLSGSLGVTNFLVQPIKNERR
jgi:hypothetical protein